MEAAFVGHYYHFKIWLLNQNRTPLLRESWKEAFNSKRLDLRMVQLLVVYCGLLLNFLKSVVFHYTKNPDGSCKHGLLKYVWVYIFLLGMYSASLSWLNITIGNVLGRVHQTILFNAIKVGYPFSSELEVVMKNKRKERWGETMRSEMQCKRERERERERERRKKVKM